MSATTGTFSLGETKVEMPVKSRLDGPFGYRYWQTLRQDRDVYLRSRVHIYGELRIGDHLHRRRRGRSPLSRLPDRPACRTGRFSRNLLPSALRRIADPDAEKGFRLPDHAAHDDPRADGPFLPGLSPRRASNGRDGRERRRLVGFLSRSTDISDQRQRMVASMRLIAKMPTLAAMAYKYTIGQPFVYPKNELDYTSNFLRMCFAVPTEEYKIRPTLTRALDRIFILHADHEQNASTSTVRLADRPAPTPSPASQRASPAFGARRMAAPMKPR